MKFPEMIAIGFATVLTLGLGVSTFKIGSDAWTAYASRNWTATQAIYQATDLIAAQYDPVPSRSQYYIPSRIQTFYYQKINYQYRFAGKMFTQTWSNSILGGAAQDKLKTVAPGSAITVFVNPANPEESTLLQGFSGLDSGDEKIIGVHLVFLLLALWGIKILFFGINSRGKAPKPDAEVATNRHSRRSAKHDPE